MEFRQDKAQYYVKLVAGEKLHESFEALALQEGITTATIVGIGKIRDPKLGLYDSKIKDYQIDIHKGDFELLNLTGNITLLDGKPFCHTHVTLAGMDYNAFGGHLFETECAAVGEFLIVRADLEVSRQLDKDLNVFLWDFSGCKAPKHH